MVSRPANKRQHDLCTEVIILQGTVIASLATQRQSTGGDASPSLGTEPQQQVTESVSIAATDPSTYAEPVQARPSQKRPAGGEEESEGPPLKRSASNRNILTAVPAAASAPMRKSDTDRLGSMKSAPQTNSDPARDRTGDVKKTNADQIAKKVCHELGSPWLKFAYKGSLTVAPAIRHAGATTGSLH